MGSYALAFIETCDVCGEAKPIYERCSDLDEPEVCDECWARRIEEHVIGHIRPINHNRGIRRIISLFLVPFRRQCARAWYTRCLLLSRYSSFCQFTYFNNGLAGNISDYEDILDRILSFLFIRR